MRRLVFLLLFVSFYAFADAVPPAMPGCPDGSVGVSTHEGEYCAPIACQSDAECKKSGQVCAELPLCIKVESYIPGRDPSPIPQTRLNVVGTCADGKCAEGAACKPAKYCAAPPKKEPAPEVKTPEKPKEGASLPPPKKESDTKTGGCATAPASNEAASLWLFAIVGALFFCRRRTFLVVGALLGW